MNGMFISIDQLQFSRSWSKLSKTRSRVELRIKILLIKFFVFQSFALIEPIQVVVSVPKAIVENAGLD